MAPVAGVTLVAVQDGGGEVSKVSVLLKRTPFTAAEIEKVVLETDFRSFVSVPSWWNVVGVLKALRRGWLSDGNALSRFLEWEKAMRLQEADLRLQGSKDNLADQEEELAQLEKMYKSDDLTEETEEIVLKRQRRAVILAHYYQEGEIQDLADFLGDSLQLAQAAKK